MALINCPQCGKEVSDKAKVCPRCGNVLIEEKLANITITVCKECGTEIPMDADICPNCGCPVEKTDETAESIPQKVEITSVNIPTVKKSIKKYVIITIVLIALAVVGIVGGILIKQNNAAKASANYKKNLKTATSTMLIGASSAESAGNLIKSVWYNTIYEEADSKTDKYTKSNGWFNEDFNDSLAALFADNNFKSTIENIKSNQETVSTFMKELQNPPAEYEEAYSSIKELYDAYLELTGLAVAPSGSLQTFSNNFNDADSETLKCYKAIDVYISD